MNKRIKSLLFIMGFSLFFASSGLCEMDKTDTKKAVNFTLTSSKSKEVNLSDYKGKIIVLEWTNDGCPFVKKFYSADKMQSLQKEMASKGVVWLTINSSAIGKQGYHEISELDEIYVKNGSNATHILRDEKGVVGKSYNAETTPTIVVIDKEFNIAYKGAIDSISSYESSDIEKADNYVEQTVAKLMSGEKIEVSMTDSYGCSVKYK